MKKEIVIYFVLFVLLVWSSCDPPPLDPECENDGHFSFELVNNSDERLFTYFYSDTLIGIYGPTGPTFEGFVSPGESEVNGASARNEHCWEYRLKDGKKEFFVIFNADSVWLIPWDTIRATNRGVLKRYEIDLEYLVNHNYIITYP